MTSTFARILSELSDPDAVIDSMRHDHSPFHLASLADCATPDSIESPGALFLECIARDVAEWIENGTDTEDAGLVLDNLIQNGAHEISDNAVPIYTHDRWATFMDLAAYDEDVADLAAPDSFDLTDLAGVALYMIAERLVRALADELSEALDDACEECGVSLGEPTTDDECNNNHADA